MTALRTRCFATSAALLLGCPSDSSDESYGVTAESGDSSDTGAPADLPMGGCSVDEHDPNGSRAEAGRIEQNEELSATLCDGGDETDWYTFTLAVPSYVGVEVLFEKDGQDVALELSEHDSGTLIERSEGGADMQATHQLLQPGTYDIEVQRVLGNPSYTLRTYALPTNTPPGTNMRGPATRVFCPRFDLDGQYEDRSFSWSMREDYGLEDSPDRWRPESMLVRVLDEHGNVRLGWAPLDDQGCTAPVMAEENETAFVLEYLLWSHYVRPQRPDTFVIVYDCEQMQPCVLPRIFYQWTTETGEAVQETRFINSAQVGSERREELLVFWAAAFSESRVSMGLDAHIYARVLGAADVGGGQYVACPTGYCPNGTSCEDAGLGYDHCRPKTRSYTNLGGHPTLDIASATVNGADYSGAPERRFTIAHEIGHLQTMWVPGIGNMEPSVNYDWCEVVSLNGSTHTADSPEWQSAAMVEGFADFYAAAVFNQFGPGAWVIRDDIENDTQRFLAQCPASLNTLKMNGKCDLPGDATSCADAGASNETDWAGTLWDFAKVVGEEQLRAVLLLLSDAYQLTWDPGSTSIDAYNNMRHAALVRFPANGIDFHAAAQANGVNR